MVRAYTLAQVTPAAALATQARAKRIPSDFERACDPQDLQIIRDVYGSRAQAFFFLGIFVTLGVAVTYFTVGIPVTLGVTCAVPSH